MSKSKGAGFLTPTVCLRVTSAFLARIPSHRVMCGCCGTSECPNEGLEVSSPMCDQSKHRFEHRLEDVRVESYSKGLSCSCAGMRCREELPGQSLASLPVRSFQ